MCAPRLSASVFAAGAGVVEDDDGEVLLRD